MKKKNKSQIIYADRTDSWIAPRQIDFNDMSTAVVDKFDLLEKRVEKLEKKKKYKIYIKRIEW